jgi:hypothetical protein
VPLSLYFLSVTEEKRAKHSPHLLDGLSPISGFLGYILCSVLWMVCSFDYSLFFRIFLIFINLKNKLVVANLRSKEINMHNKIFQYNTKSLINPFIN